jgi:hypothetical protein
MHFLQYFLPFAKDGINKQIETAILRADKMGVKVISLAALNKVCNFTCIERSSGMRMPVESGDVAVRLH